MFGYLPAKDFQCSGQKRSSTIFQSGDREEFLGLMECSARKQQREDFSSHGQKQFPDLGKGSFSGCPYQHCGFGVWEFLDIALLSRRGLWFSLSPGFGISWIPGGVSRACLKYREHIRVTLKIQSHPGGPVKANPAGTCWCCLPFPYFQGRYPAENQSTNSDNL